MKKERRKYTDEFKAKALELARTMGSLKRAAEALGVPAPSLHQWKKKAEGNPPKPSESDLIGKLQNEIRELRKELREHQQTVQVLRQATIFFCQDKSTSRSW